MKNKPMQNLGGGGGIRGILGNGEGADHFFPCSKQQSHAEVFPKNKLNPVSLTCSTGEFDEITAFCHHKNLVPVSRKSR